MAGLALCVEDLIEVDDLLNKLDIPFEENATISDGETNYYFYCFSNLNEDKKDLLLKIGFKEFKESIFFIENNTLKTLELLPYLLPLYQKNEIEIWNEIIDKIVEINERKTVFKPTSKQLKIVTVWKGKIVTSEDEFKSFINDLCLLFRESCKINQNDFRISKNCQSHRFWKIIRDLRNHYLFHDPEHRSEDAYKEAIERAKIAFEYLFPNPSTKKVSLDFIKAQFRLLTECIDFIETVSGELIG